MAFRSASVTLFLIAACSHAGPAAVPESATPRPAQPSIADFARFSRFVDAKISPGGSYLAAVSMENGHRALSIVDLKTRKTAPGINPPAGVGDFYWANDSRVLLQPLNQSGGILTSPINKGDIYSLDAATGRGHLVFGSYLLARDYSWGLVLARLHGDDQHVLIESGYFDRRPAELSKMHADSGLRTPIVFEPVWGSAIMTDELGEPRIAVGNDEHLRARYYYRDPGALAWGQLSSLKGIQRWTTPLLFESAARTLDIAEPFEKTFGVFALNIDSGEKKLLSKNQWVGPNTLLEDRQHHILAVEYQADLPTWDFVVPDHPLSRALKGLLAAYPDDNVRFVSMTDDEKKVVALVYGDRDPGRFLLVDVDKLSAEELVASRPWVEPSMMSEMTAFHLRASDGMWIHGYLTLPRSAKPGELPPLIVHPHGGPHFVRDQWGYDSEVQLLASEGFAVLQVNYRGSGGYSLQFQEAGYKHWGDRVIEDIVDATRYVIGKGYVDPKRICAYGASFGAYAAMQSAIVAPDLFRCAAGEAGIYDLALLRNDAGTRESDTSTEFAKTAIGSDRAANERQSPVYNAGKLKAKVFLIHGRQDTRAPIEQAERMRDALEKAGNKPEWLVEAREGHGFYDEGP
jgi:dipeptidyl aminopeptidase/acylaminoacyl peptidase